MQARAEATRRSILDAAVELFSKNDYADVPMIDIIELSDTSKGAFYYHFPNREAVAAAVIAEANSGLRAATANAFSDQTAPTLENFIRSVFVIAHLASHDKSIRVGIQLRNALRSIDSNFEEIPQHRRLCTAAVAAGIAENDLHGDLNPDQAGHTLSTAIMGTHRLCETTGENLCARLADVLTLILRAICIPDRLNYYDELVRSTAISATAGQSDPRPNR